MKTSDQHALPAGDDLNNATQIIERFGGIRPMAKKLNVPVTTVQGWKKRNVIPANRAQEVAVGAKKHNVDFSFADFAANGSSGAGPVTNPVPENGATTANSSAIAGSQSKNGQTLGGQAKAAVLTDQDSTRTASQAASDKRTTSSTKSSAGSAKTQGAKAAPLTSAPVETNLSQKSASADGVKTTKTDPAAKTATPKKSGASNSGSKSRQNTGGNMSGSNTSDKNSKGGWFSIPALLAAALTALLVSLLFWLLWGWNGSTSNQATATNTSQVQSLVSQSEQTQGSVTALSDRVGSLEGRVDTLSTSVQSVQATASSTSGTSAAGSTSDGAEAKIQALADQLANLSAQNQDLSAQVAAVTEQNEALKSQMKTVAAGVAGAAAAGTVAVASQASASTDGVDSAALSDLDARLAALTSDVDGLKSGFTTVSENQAALSQTQDQAQAELAEIKASQAAIKEETQNQISSFKDEALSEVATLSASVGALNEQSTALVEQQTALAAEQKAASEQAAIAAEQAEKAEAEAQMRGNRMLGVSRLRKALQEDAGFADELTFLSRNVGDDAALQTITSGLAPFAEEGAPSVDTLKSAFSDLSRDQLVAARRAAREAGEAIDTTDRSATVRSVVSYLLGRTDAEGQGVEGNAPSLSTQLRNVEDLIGEDSMGEALGALSDLDLPNADAFADWTQQAKSRQIVGVAKSTLDSWLAQFSAQ